MIGVLLITHGKLGSHFVETVTGMIGDLSRPTEVLEVHRHDDPDERSEAAAAALSRLDEGDGVLIITDAFGSTPSNIATRAASSNGTRVVAGINLSMLVRVYNYPQLALDDLAASAIEAGRAGVMACPSQADR
ncbi:PTS system fructose subfamily IIA component [Salinisphaera dokdonensis CL-ES53]|uniref:PTS system fructose subfamily IIA component n=1 Tax=Salinisphaera dokdonensis CL-ES53 TaxID=1304272 RepID=A0ABV2AYV6_9GAMM